MNNEERWAQREAEFKRNYSLKFYKKYGYSATSDDLNYAWVRHRNQWWYKLKHLGR